MIIMYMWLLVICIGCVCDDVYCSVSRDDCY